MKLWTWKRENLPSLSHAFRTALAATISILLGRLVGLPEAYWAAIATIVVMQSPLGTTVAIGDRADRRERTGRIDRGNRIDLLRPKPVRIRAGDASSRADIVCASFGKGRI